NCRMFSVGMYGPGGNGGGGNNVAGALSNIEFAMHSPLIAAHSATIGANEPTVMGLSSANIARSQSEVKTIMSALDEDGDGGVSIDEFATAAAMGKLSNEEEIKRSFDAFDLDSDGFITHIELERVCRDFLSPQAAKDLVNEVDQDHDGKITFKEWLIAMNGQSRLSVSTSSTSSTTTTSTTTTSTTTTSTTTTS
ncbi:unnamed protein product, partial [Sphagnum compactum]